MTKLYRKDLKIGDCFKYVAGGTCVNGDDVPDYPIVMLADDDNRTAKPIGWGYAYLNARKERNNYEVILMPPPPGVASNVLAEYTKIIQDSDKRIPSLGYVGGSEAWSESLRIKVSQSDAERAKYAKNTFYIDDNCDYGVDVKDPLDVTK